jgi:hypothetical protein
MQFRGYPQHTHPEIVLGGCKIQSAIGYFSKNIAMSPASRSITPTFKEDNLVTSILQFISTESNLSDRSILIVSRTQDARSMSSRDARIEPPSKLVFQVFRASEGDDEETKNENNQVYDTRGTRCHLITSRARRSSKQDELS